MRYGLKSFFHKTAQEGSNAAFCQENAIIEFQLYFVSLEQGQNGVCLEDFLLFAICHSNWPDTSLGIQRKKSKCFWLQNLLPRSSTCGGLILYLSQNVTKNTLETALKEKSSFCIIWLGLFLDTIKLYI